MVLTLAVFIIVLSVLVLVHEFGHFVVGRLAGIGILEFALGLPFTKPVWSRKLKSGMHISLYPVLFGGFVKLLGEEGPQEGVSGDQQGPGVKGKQFFKANVWARIMVVVAGVIMNLVLAIVAFYVFLGFSNFKVLVPRIVEYDFLSPSQEVVVITQVVPDSPARRAGISRNDVVTEVDGLELKSRAEFREYVKKQAGREVKLKVSDLNLQQEREVSLIPRVDVPKNEGPLGVGVGEGILVNYPNEERLTSGVKYATDMFIYNIKVLGFFISTSMQTGDSSAVTDNLSGPVGIAATIGDIINLGGWVAIVQMANFLGLLSLSLAFMNILPIPAMDGGRLVFLLVEALSGKKMPVKYENWINQAGMIVLLALIVLISYNDLVRVFRR